MGEGEGSIRPRDEPSDDLRDGSANDHPSGNRWRSDGAAKTITINRTINPPIPPTINRVFIIALVILNTGILYLTVNTYPYARLTAPNPPFPRSSEACRS